MRTLCGTILAAAFAAVLSANATDVSVASFCERAKKGERLTVAFLGGSLSWGANATNPNKTSWRARIGKRLEGRYPDAHFKFIDAAIGGTDSQLGIFRLERDVIPYKPDLVFVEWLVNDGTRSAGDNRSCSYEGIVRHLLERLPGRVPVQVMLPTRATIEEQDAAKLPRWDEQKRVGAAYRLVCVDVLGEMRRRYAEGKVDLDKIWPALIGDDVHPHDFGYGVYADIVWENVFANPSPQSPTLAKEWLFAPKYRHVVRENVAEWKIFPKGWHRDYCSMRAGTFDFLCSRWQDGLAVAANCAFNPKTQSRELLPGAVVEPLRATFRGEVLMLYGESAVQSSKCEVYVDGVRVSQKDTSLFGKAFAPSAYLVWQIGNGFDADSEHMLEIRPVFNEGEPQEFRLGSICVAGCNAAWVRPEVILSASDAAKSSQYEKPTGELQEKAQALADLAVNEGMQGALQFCAFKDGKCIVDVWAGTMTTNAGAAKINGNTLFPIFSTEKPLLATAVHRSVEQGKLKYDKPVNAYWPEFKGGGKERLTVREMLGYRSGLPDCKPGVGWCDISEMADWKGMLDWYTSCEPELEPGTKQRYMARSYGWALGGLLEKAWGRSANDLLREQVLVPAGIEHDFYFVCGDDEIGRIATAYRSEVFETMNSDIARRSLLPSAWAVSSARGIAKFYNRLCGFDGKQPLVAKATLDEALKPCRHESDPVPDAEGLKKWHMIFGMGYGLWGEANDISRVFGHGGVGGSEGLCDRSQRLAVGYTCNFENAPPKLREAFYSLVGIRWRYWKDDVNIQDLQMATASYGLEPCSIVVLGDGFTNGLARTGSGWSDGSMSVSIDGNGQVHVRSPKKGLSSVVVNWKREWPRGAMFLNDAWERSYGELGWHPLSDSEIVSPWYFLETAGGKTCGIGVETQPNAMACWKIGKDGFSLVLDVRAGGRPVRLGDRALRACRIVRAESTAGESAWQFGRRFCRMMCPKPRLPKSPVYGYNDWYCAYGKNTATNFLADAEYVMSCAKGCENPPYVVMDDGWQKNSPPVVGESGRGPWDAAGTKFGMGMPEFCRSIAALGAKPGLWYRPLRAWDELPEEQRLMADRDYLDPTVPSVRSRIVEDMRRFREWGFKLVKIDFLSYDISQLWPCDSHPFPELFIQDDRAWRDDSRTTAEVMLDLYRAMKDAAGEDVVIIGCNALNHLAAGVFELQRTGNDTSGRDWEWTRKNGVNTLAMRSIQDGAFFKVDADCVGLASEGAVPWTLNRQWMELLGRSGTPMFVSWRRELATPEVRAALADAFKRASSERETAEPIDWFETRQPRRWHFADGTAKYEW